MNATKPTTNEDLLEVMQDMMQITSDGFAQTNAKLDEHSKMLNEHSQTLAEHGKILTEHGKILAEHGKLLTGHSRELKDIKREVGVIQASVDKFSNEHAAYINDISDILDRIMVLEKQNELSQAERQELQRLLQTVAKWISKVSKVLDIPIKLPS